MIYNKYKSYIKFKILFFFCLFISLILVSLISISVGDYKLSISEIIKGFLGVGSKNVNLVLWEIRIPRLLAAILAGISLSLSGMVIQCLLRNPLASPFTVGISHGAMFGASLAIFFGALSLKSGNIIVNNPYIITISAFLGALISVFIVLLIAKLKNLSPEALILAGVAMASFFTACTTLIQYFADELQLAAMIYWTFGDLGRATWSEIWIMTIVSVFGLIYFYKKSWDFNALESGDETAKSLGVEVEKCRLFGMIIASFITSVTVAFLGIIGFIGLIAPHMVRLIIGGDYRYLMINVPLFGALLLVIADLMSRILLAPVVLPVGILTSFIGAPLFIYLIIKLYK
ncbi:FecCD family ABC transporter permease [Methanocaldococcus sp.]